MRRKNDGGRTCLMLNVLVILGGVRKRVTRREGSNTKFTSRFAAVRVRPAHRDYERSTPRPEEWCLIEWPAGEAELDPPIRPERNVLSSVISLHIDIAGAISRTLPRCLCCQRTFERNIL
jgi:SRSO17 transposase